MPNGQAYQVIQGAGRMYTGVFSATGANEPALTAVNVAPQASAWTYTGFTSDGITLTINQSFSEMRVDQLADRIGTKLTERELAIQANLAEATLANLTLGLNGGTITTGAGPAAYSMYEPIYDGSELQPVYIAVLFDGYAPASAAGVSKRRRIILRKALSTENVESSYKKDSLTLVPVTFTSHYVSDTVASFRIIDES
jgi:hypothetical protein